uniref:Uncharacterized protein n=1 Tax=Rhizophora mucronata TaxID=61149 RepID=A0A2P2PEB3_RHIMU
MNIKTKFIQNYLMKDCGRYSLCPSRYHVQLHYILVF